MDNLNEKEKENLNDNSSSDALKGNNLELSAMEREELESLRKEKQKSRNIYDRVNVKPETLTKVIIFGVIAILAAVIIGLLTK
ncbi:MAG: hypothetical protein RR327_06565 [Clostridia bacterium]